MARLPRLTLAGHLHHVILRGNNRQTIFTDAADFEFMHGVLVEQARQDGVAVHAYVLMDNHFHLLLTPQGQDSLARFMQGIGRRYVRYYNARFGRSGTLWEGRFRSALLQPERYLLACMVYQDLNPVRAGVVQEAAQYPWSSHAHYTGRSHDRLVTPHPVVWQLGNTPFAREQAYAQLVGDGLPRELEQTLTDSGLHGWALGDDHFLASLQRHTTRRLSRSLPGRPRKRDSSPESVPN